MGITRFASKMFDFSKGILGGVSDLARKPRHLAVAENVLLRPFGALQVRKGSQRACSATLAKEPHTVMEYVPASGTASVFEGCKDSGTGKLYKMSGSAFTLQVTAFPLHITNYISWDQLNDSLWMAQPGAAGPMFFATANPTDTWHTMALPRPSFPAMDALTPVTIVSSVPPGQTVPGGTTCGPVVAGATTLTMSANAGGGVNAVCVVKFGNITVPNCKMTNGSAVVTYNTAAAAAQAPFTLTNGAVAGGALTVTTVYNYRLRYRYKNGSSLASAVVTAGATGGALPQSVAVSNIVNDIRSDYVGWTLERTKPGGTVAGPWYVLANSTDAVTTTYTDLKADGDLGARTDPDDKHGEPQAFSGLIAHRDRLFGWIGSVLYASQSIADVEDTGIANWHPLNGYEFGKDDGDSIQTVVRQGDRLVICKRWSVWALEGFDPASFVVVPIYQGAGASGLRCAGGIGGNIWLFGDAGLHLLSGNKLDPFGWEEVGHIFDQMSKTRFADVVVRSYLGQLLLISFSTAGARNDSFMVYDQRFGGWTKFTNWFAQDILIQRGASFGDAQTLLFCDSRDFGGSDYRSWMGLNGFKDERAANGTGGTAVRVVLTTPYIDDGSPDVSKYYERLMVFAQAGADTSMTLTVEASPSQDTRSFSVTVTQSGTKWGTPPQDHVSAPLWGSFKWGKNSDATAFSGLRAGLTGTRYRVNVVASCPSDFQFKGHALDVLLLPERRMS